MSDKEEVIGQPTEPGEAPVGARPEVEDDPDVIAEEKKLRIWQLRIQRFGLIAKGVSLGLQTFKAEAVSLVSGIGTLVLGWFQLKKWVLTERHEVKALARATEARASSEGGAGHGRPEAAEARVPARSGDLRELLESAGGVPVDLSRRVEVPTMMTDPNTYVWMALVVAFVASSVRAWLKSRAKKAAQKEAPHGN